MTELEAINIMLGVIGEAPVDSLATADEQGLTDAGIARTVLREVSRDVQAEGWSWNQSQDVPLTKDGAGHFLFPSNTLREEIYPTQDSYTQYVRRGLKLYDKKNRVAKFPEMEEFTVSLLTEQLDWEEVPHTVQQYIVIRSSRIYSNRYVNSSEIYSYTQQDEQYARAMMIRDEQSEGRDNMLWGSQRGIGQGIGYSPAAGTRYRHTGGLP